MDIHVWVDIVRDLGFPIVLAGGTDSSYKGTVIGVYCYDGAGATAGIVYGTIKNRKP